MILPAARIATQQGTLGSGFVVASNASGTYVITNHHVIRDSIQQSDFWDPVKKSSEKRERLQPVDVQTFRYDERGLHTQTVSTSAEIVAYTQYGDEWDFEGDMAVLKLRATVEGMPSANVMSEEDFLAEVRPLDDIVMVGCPDGSRLPVPTTGHVASLSEERGSVGLLLSQIFGNPGSSGSAVYRYSPEREQYELIAVHSMVDSRGKLTDTGKGHFLRVAVPVPKIHEFLKAHGLSSLVTPPGQEGESAPADKEGEGSAAAGETEDGVEGNATDSAAGQAKPDATDGNATDGNATDGNAVDGNVTDANNSAEG